MAIGRPHHCFSLPRMPKITGDRITLPNGDAAVGTVDIADEDEAVSVASVAAFVVFSAAVEDRHTFKMKMAVVSNAVEADINIQICVQRLIRIATGVVAKAIFSAFAAHQEPQWVQIVGPHLVQ